MPLPYYKILRGDGITLCLTVDLKIFQIDDGEQHYIVANTKESAKKFYNRTLNFDEIPESYLEIIEIQKDDDIQINLNQDDDLLLELINRYKNIKEKTEDINIWALLKYEIIAKELQNVELEIPFIISSSTF